jgi:hypothetical protein
MLTMAHKAQDTFVAEINGAPVVVQKGSVWADNDPVVKLDAGRGLLFKPLDFGDENVPVKRPRGRPRKVAAGEVPAEENGDG